MKIFHILSNRTWGGGEVYALTLAKEQRQKGHQVEIICANRPHIINRFKEEGFKVHKLQLHGHINLLAPLKFANILRKSAEPTVVHVHRIPDTIFVTRAISHLSSKKRPAFVMTHHLIEPPIIDRSLDKPYSMLDHIICVSQKSKNTLLSVPSNIDPKKVSVILNSTKIISDPHTDELPSVKSLSITYIGRLVPEKGVDTLIKALPSVSEARLIICGDGKEDYVKELHNLVEQLKVEDRIDWIGFTKEVKKYILNSDIGVIPSRWEEPFGLVIIEFMANYIPVVTTNNGAQPEIITDGVEGFLVPPDDPQALAEAINKLIDDPDLRIKMGKAARNTFERRFTYDKFYNQVMDVYDEALKAKNYS